jgi:hypothetical protein
MKWATRIMALKFKHQSKEETPAQLHLLFIGPGKNFTLQIRCEFHTGGESAA